MSATRLRRRFQGDGAFTLIEVLMAVFLTAAIVGAVAAAVMVTLGPDQRSADQLLSSHDAQLASIWIPADLESAGPVDPAVDLAAATPLACTGAVPGTNVLRLQWVQPDPVATAYAVSYRLVTVGTEAQLVRVWCTDGGTLERLVIARHLRDASSAGASVDGQRVTLTFTTSHGDDVRVSGTRRTPTGGPTTTAPTTTLPPTTTSSTTTSTSTTTTTAPPTTTTTTTPPTTTTTTAPTTTTTAPTTTTTASSTSCRVQSVTASPGSIGRRADGRLTGNVTVTVTTSGSGNCGALELRYQTWWFLFDFTATTSLSRSGNTWTGTIPGGSATGAQVFSAGSKELMVIMSNGAELPPAGTLVVT